MNHPTLHYCHRGNEVVRLQLMLRELDFTLEPDGIFGPMTREAVKTFQALHDLPVTGEADPVTWDLLEDCFHLSVCIPSSPAAQTMAENDPDRRNNNESIQGAEPPPGREPAELAGHVSQAL